MGLAKTDGLGKRKVDPAKTGQVRGRMVTGKVGTSGLNTEILWSRKTR